MTIESDTLKTLHSIEALLKGATSLNGKKLNSREREANKVKNNDKSSNMKPNQNFNKLVIPFKAQIGRMVQQFGNATSAVGGLGISASNVSDVLKKLTGDYFTLASVGLGTVNNLAELSKNAFLSGMSLREYQQVISDNITVASRSGSLENFDKIISAADGQLASMGVFGMEARQMQASLAESSTLMGVKQAQLTDVISGQISIFDNLRKSTNMTAEEFSNLVSSVASNEQVQREMLGVAPNMRAAKMLELQNVAMMGSKMGLAADASKQLTTALLAQRGDTVKGRIEGMGRVRQLGQLVGMGAESERAAQLLIKGRSATKQEQKELTQIAMNLNRAAEGAYSTGSLGVQSGLDILNEMLGGTKMGQLMQAAMPAALAQDSAAVNNKDFGKHVGEFGQFTAELLKYFRGFDQSFGPMVGGLVGGLGLAMFRGPIVKAIQLGLGKMSVIGSAGAGAAAGGAGAAGAGFSVLKFLKGTGIFAGVIGALTEAFTGELASALNPEGGFLARLGGIVTSFFTAIPNFLIDAAAFVFGEDALSGIRNVFDTVVAYTNMAFKKFLGTILGSTTQVLKWMLPDNSPLVKLMDRAAEGLFDSALSNQKAGEELWNNNSMSLEKMANRNKKSAEAAITKVTTVQDKFNNVQQGLMISQGSLMSDARALIGSPQVQVQKSITPNVINTPDGQTQSFGQAQIGGQSTSDLLTALNTVVAVLRDSLISEQRQVELTEMLLRNNRPQAVFPSSEVTASTFLYRT